MSAAEVSFETLDHEPAGVGAEARFGFACPKHKGRTCEGLLIAGRSELKRDGQNQNGGAAQWDWNGDRERPTFAPSINCMRCWHGYIRDGRCVDTAGRDEPEPAAAP